QALGYVSSGIWGGISAGPVIGNWLGTFTHAAGFQLGAALAAFGLALLVREDFKPHRHRGERRVVSSYLLTSGLAIGFANVHYPVIAGFLILFLAQHGGSGPAAFSTYALAVLLSRFFLGGLPDRIRPAVTFNAGLAAMGTGLLVLAAGPRPMVAIVAAGLLGFGFSFPWSSVASTILRRTPAQNHGSVVGVLSAFYDLFVGAGSLLAGRIANRHGYSAAFLMAAVALIGAAVAGRFVFNGRIGEASGLPEATLEPIA